MANQYKYNYKFKFSRFDKALAFQTLDFTINFINIIPTLLPSLKYIATNNVIINISTNSATQVNISTYIINSNITISPANNVSTIQFANNQERDDAYLKILSALNEFGKFIENNGIIAKNCKSCFNYLGYNYNYSSNVRQFCTWIIDVNPMWDINTDYCSAFSLYFTHGPQREIIYI